MSSTTAFRNIRSVNLSQMLYLVIFPSEALLARPTAPGEIAIISIVGGEVSSSAMPLQVRERSSGGAACIQRGVYSSVSVTDEISMTQAQIKPYQRIYLAGNVGADGTETLLLRLSPPRRPSLFAIDAMVQR